jgi:predicted phage terminase large subunit-like protein
LSLNLGSQDCKKRFIGTRYHSQDTYKTILDRKSAIPRIYPATDNGTFSGNPILFTPEQFKTKVNDMGSYIASCQLLLNPLADNAMGFDQQWLRYYLELHSNTDWNYYILVDPASKKKKENDYTVMAVIALAPDNNYYLIDAIRDRMNLTQRTEKVFEFHKKYKTLNVGYEEYGLSCDIEHIQYVQEQRGYRFEIMPLGGSMGKVDRIRRLIPIFEQKRFYIPTQLLFYDMTGKQRDFIKELLDDEYKTFPVSSHDDMLDCISRIVEPDLKALFPMVKEKVNQYRKPIYSQECNLFESAGIK